MNCPKDSGKLHKWKRLMWGAICLNCAARLNEKQAKECFRE